MHGIIDNTLVQRATRKVRVDSLIIHEELDLRTNHVRPDPGFQPHWTRGLTQMQSDP